VCLIQLRGPKRRDPNFEAKSKHSGPGKAAKTFAGIAFSLSYEFLMERRYVCSDLKVKKLLYFIYFTEVTLTKKDGPMG
jgi:hypothetical protein